MTGPVHYDLTGFPPGNLDWAWLAPLIGEARAALARYDGLVAAMPGADVLLAPLITHEAVCSSRIEGANVTMSEVLEIEAGSDSESMTQPKLDDAEEVINYRRALRFASEALRDRSLSLYLLRGTHTLLMQGVRGSDKNPGAFRKRQNWLGPRGCPIEQADFIPIPQEHLQTGLERWITYMRNHSEPDPLTQLAAIHVEFEALHPFEDGNGRLGRILIPLFLYERKILARPNFYLSGYLEAHREQYVESMRAVSREETWTAWCAFFLQGVAHQATENQHKAQAILELYQGMLREVAGMTRSQHVNQAVQFLFSNPVFASTHFVQESDIPKSTALRFLKALRERKLLRIIRKGRGRKAAIYVFPALMSIIEGELTW